MKMHTDQGLHIEEAIGILTEENMILRQALADILKAMSDTMPDLTIKYAGLQESNNNIRFINGAIYEWQEQMGLK